MSGTPQAIILAAGIGSRLRAVSEGQPKCLIRVGGRPILEHQIDAMRRAGVVEFVIVTGYRPELVREAAERIAPDAQFTFVHNQEYDRTNVLTSWFMGSQALSKDHIYAHGDTVFGHEFLSRVCAPSRARLRLAVDAHACGEEEMKVRVRDGQLVEISKTQPSAEASGEFTGIMRVDQALLPRLREIAADLLEREYGERMFVEAALQIMIDEGEDDLFGLVDVSDLPWREIDFPEDLESADRMFSAGGRRVC